MKNAATTSQLKNLTIAPPCKVYYTDATRNRPVRIPIATTHYTPTHIGQQFSNRPESTLWVWFAGGWELWAHPLNGQAHARRL